jgi:hypothetical protein
MLVVIGQISRGNLLNQKVHQTSFDQLVNRGRILAQFGNDLQDKVVNLDVLGLSHSHDEQLDVNLVDKLVVKMLYNPRQSLKAVQLEVLRLLNGVPGLRLDDFSIVKLNEVNQDLKIRRRFYQL